MKNYFQDPEAMACPWVESPFAMELLTHMYDTGELTEEQYDIADQFINHGFCVIDLELTDEFLDTLVTSLDERIMEGAVKTQEGGYHYGNGPRVFEAWKWNPQVLDLCNHPRVREVLYMLYRRLPMPFQTINFKHGSNQPIHSDALHFHTVPERWVCGVWTALQDIDDQCGPLVYYPRSHKAPIVEFQDLRMNKSVYGAQFENYAEYERWLQQWVEVKNLTPKLFTAKKGQALIWAANLIHGGHPPVDPQLTRWSQATHYYFPCCEHYYSPMFSNKWAGDYAEKDLETKNISHHVLPGSLYNPEQHVLELAVPGGGRAELIQTLGAMWVADLPERKPAKSSPIVGDNVVMRHPGARARIECI